MTGVRPHSIAFWTLPEAGHLTPTLRIASTLRDRGHRVAFVAPATMAERIGAAGFEVVPWFDELYSEHWRARITEGNVLARRRAITERYTTMAETLQRGEGAAAALGRFAPDAVVADVNEPLIGWWAHAQGHRVVVLNTSLPQTRDPKLPPLRGAGAARTDAAGRLATAWAWRRFLTGRRVSARAARLVGAEPPYSITDRFGRELGLAPGALDRDTVFYSQLRDRPELVLCPDAFDFPRPHRSLRYFVESMDRRRHDQEGPATGLPPGDGPLVYCSLGTQRYRTDLTPALFGSMVELAAARPDRRFVLSLGQHLEPARLGPLPPNVTAHRSVPQVAVLREAAAMVTHGGLGTVKECVLAGVPMVVVPLAVDQEGNAARVVHHGIGRLVPLGDATATVLGDRLDDLIGSASVRDAMARLTRAFERVEDADLGADVVEAVAGRRPLPANPAPRPPLTPS